MDFASSYSSHLEVRAITPGGTPDGGRVAGVTGMAASRSVEGTAPSVDAATIELAGAASLTGLARVYLVATQNGEQASYPIMTGIAERGDAAGAGSATVLLRGVLHKAERVWLPDGTAYYEGADVLATVARALSDAMPGVTVRTEGASPTLAETLVYTSEVSVLQACWELCGSSCEIVTDPEGVVTVRARPTDALAIGRREITADGISVTTSAGEAPNRITYREGGATYVATNDDPASEVSVPRRGYVVDGTPKGARMASETAQQFADRELAEQSVVTETATYTRDWRPDVGVGDRVTLPGHEGTWRVVGQDLSYTTWLAVDETATREVRA